MQNVKLFQKKLEMVVSRQSNANGNRLKFSSFGFNSLFCVQCRVHTSRYIAKKMIIITDIHGTAKMFKKTFQIDKNSSLVSNKSAKQVFHFIQLYC